MFHVKPDPEPGTITALHVVWEGHVQGVGFRAAAQAAAIRCDVGGWVRNLPDGGVEAYLVGPPPAIAAVLEEVSRARGRFIRSRRTEDQTLPRELPTTFEIR